MAKAPILKPREVVAILNALGFACVRQREAQMRVQPSEPQHFYGERVRDLALP